MSIVSKGLHVIREKVMSWLAKPIKNEILCSQATMEPEPKRRAVHCDDLFLPIEIWKEILIRLPAMLVLRCRSVCKSWYSLISCSDFISDHSTRNLNKSDNGRVLLRVFDDSNVWSYISCDDSFTKFREHDDIAKEFLGPDLDVVGSCNGLICLSKYSKSGVDPRDVTFFIWNPTIKKVVELPSRTFCPRTHFPSYFGFGFDSDTNDYKVLMSFDVLNGNSRVVKNMSELFDLRKGAWRTISPRMCPWNVCDRTNPECYLNGAVHWSGFRNTKYFNRYLLSFDMSSECFQVIRFPKCAEFTLKGNDDGRHIDTQSMTIGGLIYVVVFTRRSDDEIDMSRRCSLWVMKEYGVTESWTKVSTINLQSFLDKSIDHLWPERFHLWENGEVLVAHDTCDDAGSKQDFILYDVRRRKFRCIFTTTKYFKNLCRYEESLVLMEDILL